MLVYEYGSDLVFLFIQAKFGEVFPYKYQETASKAFKSHHREQSFLREGLSSSCPNIGQTTGRWFSGFGEILHCHTLIFSCFPKIQFQKINLRFLSRVSVSSKILEEETFQMSLDIFLQCLKEVSYLQVNITVRKTHKPY